MGKKIILVGPSASGKNYLREKFIKRGYTADCSYTTRPKRDGEVEGVDYHFISRDEFHVKIKNNEFQEWVKYKDDLYGTGKDEWEIKDIFIKETVAISKMTPEERDNSFIIFINPPKDTRIKRMMADRGWDWETVKKRLEFDEEAFGGFSDYDLKIKNPRF